jgi:Etoposide-induced protein 2.4 (EI24)
VGANLLGFKLTAMNKLLDSFWRAALYCLHPRVIALSLLPLVIMAALALGFGYFFWADTVAMLRSALDGFDWLGRAVRWVEAMGLPALNALLAPTLLLLLSVPVIVIASLLFVAVFMTPAMVSLVGERRFPRLEKKKGGSFWTSVAWSLGSTVVAVIALLMSIPLWLIPPLVLVLPPLIWGWLTYRVMAYDALSDHADAEERRHIFRAHRMPLLAIGVLSGYLGAAPSLIWASGAVFIAMAPVLVPVAIWIYTLVFAFSSLWFAHYTLGALEQFRNEKEVFAQINRAQKATEMIANESRTGTMSNPSPPPAQPPL